MDGPHNGPAPGPWDLQMVVGQEFKDAKTKMEVPHTASVKVSTQKYMFSFITTLIIINNLYLSPSFFKFQSI